MGMEVRELEELCRRKHRQSLLLIEASDLTKQLEEALNRKDEVSMQMLMEMREAPLHGMREIEAGIETYLLSLPESSAIRGKALLCGGAVEEAAEEPLYEEVAKYRRLLSSVIERDREISIRLGGEKSFYNTFRAK